MTKTTHTGPATSTGTVAPATAGLSPQQRDDRAAATAAAESAARTNPALHTAPPAHAVSAADAITGSDAALGDSAAPGTVTTIPPPDPDATTQLQEGTVPVGSSETVDNTAAAEADTSQPDTHPGLEASPPVDNAAEKAAIDDRGSNAVEGPLGPVDSKPDASHKIADGEMPQL
jgi:hypothetical protein